MLVAEELLLLCLDEETGRPRLGRDRLEPGLAGALLAELGLLGRIGVTPEEAGWTKRGRLTLLSRAPTGDAELDRALAAAAAAEGRRAKDLVQATSSRRISRGLRQRLLDRLRAAGVLEPRTRKVLGLFPSATWPAADRSAGQELRERLRAALVVGLTPDERTVALVALLQVTGVLTQVLDREDRSVARARAKEISRDSWAAAAVKLALQEVGSASG